MSLFPLDTIKTRYVRRPWRLRRTAAGPAVQCQGLKLTDLGTSSMTIAHNIYNRGRLQSSEGFWKAGGFRGIYKGLGAAAAGSAPGGAWCGSLFVVRTIYLANSHSFPKHTHTMHSGHLLQRVRDDEGRAGAGGRRGVRPLGAHGGSIRGGDGAWASASKERPPQENESGFVVERLIMNRSQRNHTTGRLPRARADGEREAEPAGGAVQDERGGGADDFEGGGPGGLLQGIPLHRLSGGKS